ncbi:MAG: DNA-binding protein [Hyphomonadaceae bacterium]
MTTQVLHFSELSERDREAAAALPKLAPGDRVELRVAQADGGEQRVSLPPEAAAAVEAVLAHLARGERVVVLTEDQELSPSEAAIILGVSRPLVVLRMDRGDLPFRYVGAHRRARLKDVLRLKAELDKRQEALDALAEDTEELARDHGV